MQKQEMAAAWKEGRREEGGRKEGGKAGSSLLEKMSSGVLSSPLHKWIRRRRAKESREGKSRCPVQVKSRA